MELEYEDVNQMQTHLNFLINKLNDETAHLHTTETNFNNLLQQQLSSVFEFSENDKLLIKTIKSLENVQKSSLVTVNETNQSVVQFNNKSESVLKDYALLERSASEMESNNLHRFNDLPNSLCEEAVANKTIEIDKQLNDISDAIEKNVNKFKRIKDEHLQLKKERKMLTKNVSSFTTSIKKLNFQRDLEKN